MTKSTFIGICGFVFGFLSGTIVSRCIAEERHYDDLLEKYKTKEEDVDYDENYPSGFKAFDYNKYPGLEHITKYEFKRAHNAVISELKEKTDELPPNIDTIVNDELFRMFKEAEDLVGIDPDGDDSPDMDKSFADIIKEQSINCQ